VVTLIAAPHAAEPATLLRNGGFEETREAPGVPPAGGTYGSWVLHGSATIPAEWTLSGYFGGELTVLAEGASEGMRFLRVAAGKERQAHLHQACPDLRAERAYRVSLRHRGGAAAIMVYEYLPEGGAPRVETVATGPSTGDLAGEWRTLDADYLIPDTVVRVAFAAAAEAGQVTDLDDVRVVEAPPEAGPGGPGWLNVRDLGASGSAFETTATTTAGSNQITVANAGDFRPGQGVMVSKCNPHYTGGLLRGPDSFYGKSEPLEGVAELRGFDGSAGDWLVFILDTDGDQPLSFRWSDDLARTWKARQVPVTWDWQKLSGGLEVKLLKRDLVLGHGITFTARTQLLTRIERVEGNTLWLRDAPTKSVTDAVVRHGDGAALQAAVDRAIRLRRNLFFPNGYYRLEHGLTVKNAAIRIEGASGVNTVIDISDGTGAAFGLYGGREVTIRHFRMLGHTGLDERPGTMQNARGQPFWCCALKPCNAVSIANTERVLCEDLHVARMASEAFYCQGSSRTAPDQGPAVYTRSLTFLRCSVTDSAANAFNNNDTSENTCVLYCRIDGAGWHAYEGPGRFIKLIGNYVRNSGPFTVGDMNHRLKDLTALGCGQAVVADNVFEGCNGLNGGIAINHGSTQVTISNNLFINYRGTAITVTGETTRQSYPSRQAVVSGNIIDLTSVGGPAPARTGIVVAASDVTVSDNQVYVRGDLDSNVTGIRIAEPAVNVLVHDNQVCNTGHGIVAQRCRSSVTEVADDGSFRERSLPLEWPVGHRYRGWRLVWLGGTETNQVCTIAEFDAETCRFKLAQPRQVQVGDAFGIFPPSANWTIHSNAVTDCRRPVTLDGYGSPTSVFRDNTITRGQATGVEQAIAVVGEYRLAGNHVHGFDEPGSGALVLYPCPIGRSLRNIYRDNLFEDCAQPVQERARGLWEAAVKDGNLFVGGPSAAQAALPQAPGAAPAAVLVPAAAASRTVWVAAKADTPIVIDGQCAEWPWAETRRVARLQHAPQGDELAEPQGHMCAAWDDRNLYFAMRFAIAKGTQPKAGLNWTGDGVELSFRATGTEQSTQVFVLWGTVDGTFHGSTAMGASASQVRALEQGVAYAAWVGETEWSCEWKVSFAAMGLTAPPAKGLRLNVGRRILAGDFWAAWVATGGRICEVDSAGELRLAEK
jgi:hypothetical protein